jgi:hypothetical protein
MATPRKKGNFGQQFLGPIQEGVEANFKARPLGMPCLAAIKQETRKLGLPDTDAEHIYDVWLMDGFKTKRGLIQDWKAAIRNWYRHRWFASQKTPQAIDRDAEALKARFRRMRE